MGLFLLLIIEAHALKAKNREASSAGLIGGPTFWNSRYLKCDEKMCTMPGPLTYFVEGKWATHGGVITSERVVITTVPSDTVDSKNNREFKTLDSIPRGKSSFMIWVVANHSVKEGMLNEGKVDFKWVFISKTGDHSNYEMSQKFRSEVPSANDNSDYDSYKAQQQPLQSDSAIFSYAPNEVAPTPSPSPSMQNKKDAPPLETKTPPTPSPTPPTLLRRVME